MEQFEEAMDLWIMQSQKKSKELHAKWLIKNEGKKKRSLFQMTKTDAKAFVAAVLHMGLTIKALF